MRTTTGEYLWQAGPEWPRSAPLLFPVIARLPHDELIHDGMRHPMPQHGIARDAEFEVLHTDASQLVLALRADRRTRDAFPWDFALTCTFSVDASSLTVETVVAAGDEPLIAKLGGHPGFAWPLPGAEGREHRLRLDRDEAPRVRRLDQGLLTPDAEAGPLTEGSVVVRPGLFDRGALIFDELESRSARWEADGVPGVTMEFADFPVLGFWSPVGGAPFVCLEPWSGLPWPAELRGEYTRDPGTFHLEPGGSRAFSYSVTIG